MVCSLANELIAEYIDDVLEDRVKLELEAHLKECSLCKQRLEEQKVIVKRLNSMDPVKPPADFLSQVHTRIERRAEFENLMKKAFVPGKIKMSFEAVGVLVSIVLVIVAYQYIQKDFPFFPSEPVNPQVFIKETKIMSFSADNLGESNVSVVEGKQEFLKPQEEMISMPESKDTRPVVEQSKIGNFLPMQGSALTGQSDVSSPVVRSVTTGQEAQTSWEPKQSSYDETLGPAMSKVPVTSVQPTEATKVSAEKEGVNKSAAFVGVSAEDRSEQLNKTDVPVNINSDLAVSKAEYLSEAKEINYQEIESILTKQNVDVRSAVNKSVIEPRASVVLRIDIGRLAMDNVYPDMIKFITGVSGSVIRSDYDKDGTMRALIVEIPSENVLKLKKYLETVDNVPGNDVKVTSFPAQ